MAELDSRLTAQMTETEKLKVSRITVQLSVISEALPLTFICINASSCSTSAPSTFPPLSSLSSSLVQEEAKRSSETRAELEQQLASATSTVAILQTEKAKLQTEVQESKKEQDDLLMLLADQDQKIHSLKQRLKDLGETVDTLRVIFFFDTCFPSTRVVFNT